MSTPLPTPLMPTAARAVDAARTSQPVAWVQGLGLAALVLLAGLVTTLLLWRDASERTTRAADARFEYRTERIHGELDHRMEEYEATLRSVAGLIGARPGFDRSHWRRFFEKSPLSTQYPGRLLVAYAPRLQQADREAHEQSARADGMADYRVISQGGAARGETYPLAFVRRVVETPALPAGLDLADDPQAAEALTRAGREGKAIMAGPLRWSASQAEEHQIWVLVVPVYGGASVPETPAERLAAVTGYLLEAFNPMDTAGSSLGPDAKLIGMKVHDGDLPLFTCPEMKRELSLGFKPTLRRSSTLTFGERTWTLEFVALPGYLKAAEGDQQPRIVATSGVIITLLLAGLMGVVARQRARAVELVAERTGELRHALERSESSETRMRAVLDHALDAIITIDDHGLIQTFNPAAERTFATAPLKCRGAASPCSCPRPTATSTTSTCATTTPTASRASSASGAK